MQDQLDRSIEIPRKRIPWLKYFFQFVIPAFLVSLKSTAQKATAASETVVLAKSHDTLPRGNAQIRVGKVAPTAQKAFTVSGKVVHEKHEAVPYATIRVKGTQIATVADDYGLFSMKLNLKENFILQISAVGYETLEVILKPQNTWAPTVFRLERQQTTEKEVVVVTAGLVICRKPDKQIIKVDTTAKIKRVQPPVEKKSRDTYEIFPNPLQSGSLFYIEWRKKEAGDYSFEILNAAGQKVFAKQLYIDEKAGLLELEAPKLPAGSYYFTLINKESGKSFTEKVIVQ